MKIKALVGKTIKTIKHDAINYIEIEFTDGTHICFESVNTGLMGLTAIEIQKAEAG